MEFNEFLETKNLTRQQYENAEQENKKKLKKEFERINYFESIDKEIRRETELQEKRQEIYQKRMSDSTDQEVYQSLYEHISEVFGPWLTDHECSGKLKLVDKYLKKYAKNPEQKKRIKEYIENHGGYCDCEFILNCPPYIGSDKETTM